MHILICILLGGMFAWGVCRKNESAASGDWHLRAGMLGGAFPHLDFFFPLIAPYAPFIMPDRFGLLWTPLLLPFYAGILASLLAWGFKKNWMILFTATLTGMAAAVAITLLTGRGIEILPLVAQWRVGLGFMYRFDFVVLTLCAVVVALGVLLYPYRRDMARAGVALLLVYVGCTIFWHYQARQVAHDYAKALKVDVEKIYVLPQPLSPLNWRVVVASKDGYVHDTLINLYRQKPLEVAENTTRAYRIAALYKPVNEAVWRVYNRMGSQQLTRAQRAYGRKAWAAFKSEFPYQARFAVLEGFTLPPTTYMQQLEACAQFKDLRYEGARRDELGVYLACGNRDVTGFAIFEQLKGEQEGRAAVFKLLKK